MGHSDTVLGPADVPFRHDPATGRIQGAGVCDMKGGNVLLVEAVGKALERHAAVRDTELAVLFNCSEESAGPSFRQLVRPIAAGARACLNFEPARLGVDGRHLVVVGRKSSVRCRVTCRGRAAHAGNEHAAGINAVRQVARIVEQLESLTDYSRDLTVNVGAMHGGLVANQVPDEAHAVFGVRTFDPALLEDALARIRAICTTPTVRSARDGAPAQLTFEHYVSYPCWPQTAATLGLAKRYTALAEKHGIAVDTLCCGGAADANHVADLCPALDGLGIVGDDMHTHHEWADARSFEARTHAAADLIGELCAT
jgi:glutamate carboxypeptidase